MATPFIDINTIQDLQNRLSAIESQLGMSTSTTSSSAGKVIDGLFFVSSSSGSAPSTNTDTSKVKIAAFDTDTIAKFDKSISNKKVGSFTVQPFVGCQKAYFAVTPKIYNFNGKRDSLGSISTRYTFNPTTGLVEIYASRNAVPGTDLTNMVTIGVAFSVIGIALFA